MVRMTSLSPFADRGEVFEQQNRCHQQNLLYIALIEKFASLVANSNIELKSSNKTGKTATAFCLIVRVKRFILFKIIVFLINKY